MGKTLRFRRPENGKVGVWEPNIDFFKFDGFLLNLWPQTIRIIDGRVMGSFFDNFHIADCGLADLVV